MRTVITISLNSKAYQLEAVGYEALRAYLQVAEQRLAGNPDQREILADLEQAIADKCGRYLGPYKNVVTSEEINEVLREMGPVEGGAEEGARQAAGGGGVGDAKGVGAGASGGGFDAAGNAHGADAAGADAGAANSAGSGGGASGPDYFGTAGDWNTSGTSGGYGAAAGAGAAGETNSGGTNTGGTAGTGASGNANSGTGAGGPTPGEPLRRLYLIREGAMVGGVCKGLAAYLNIDVSIVRLLFVVLVVLTGGVWILVYIVMMFVIPYAQTSEQHAAAHGWRFNAEELVNRAKAHYAEFRGSQKMQRRQWKEQRRMWKFQHKQWQEQQRAWERWGSAQGAPPPPPWGPGQQPANASYSSQVLHGIVRPITELLGALLFIAFMILLVSLVTRHRIFGWWLPHDIPLWLGVVILVVLYRAVAAPLRQARYSAYYGTPFAHGWVALWGTVVWLGLVAFLSWLAWQHWPDVQEFLQDMADGWRRLMQQRPDTSPAGPERTAVYYLAALPSCALHSWTGRKVQSHGEVDGADMLGEATDGDVVDPGRGDLLHGFE